MGAPSRPILAALLALAALAGCRTDQAGRAQKVTLVLSRSQADRAFEELREQGLRVVELGGPGWLQVPAEFRGRPVDGRELVEAIAAYRGLRVVWLRGGSVAVIQKKVPDRIVEPLLAGLRSTDPAVRREAAWRSGWVRDVRSIPLLVAVASGADRETAHWAGRSLERLGWPAAILCGARDRVSLRTLLALMRRQPDERERAKAIRSVEWLAPELLEVASADEDGLVRAAAAEALGYVCSQRAKAALEILTKDKDEAVRQAAMSALGRIGDKGGDGRRAAADAVREGGGRRSLRFFEEALRSKDVRVRLMAALDLGDCGDPGALALLGRALADKDSEVRWSAAISLGSLGDRRAVEYLEKAMKDGDREVRGAAAWGLGVIGDRRARFLLARSLRDEDMGVRMSAVIALSIVGGAEALFLIRKALEDHEPGVREEVTDALRYGDYGPAGLPILEKCLADDADYVRHNAAWLLGDIGGSQARELLLARLKGEKDESVLERICKSLEAAYPEDPEVTKAVSKCREGP